MGFGVNSVFDCTIPSGTCSTSDVNLGRAWATVWLDTVSIGGPVTFQAAPARLGSPGTYRNINSGTGGPGTAAVASALSGQMVQVALHGFQFVKVVCAQSAPNGTTFRLLCADE